MTKARLLPELIKKRNNGQEPLLDVLREYYSTKELTSMIEDQIIEIAPLAFMRKKF